MSAIVHSYRVCTRPLIQSLHASTHTESARVHSYRVCTHPLIQSLHASTHTESARVHSYRVCTRPLIQSLHASTHTESARVHSYRVCTRPLIQPRGPIMPIKSANGTRRTRKRKAKGKVKTMVASQLPSSSLLEWLSSGRRSSDRPQSDPRTPTTGRPEANRSTRNLGGVAICESESESKFVAAVAVAIGTTSRSSAWN
jgi:hypothetical protein